MAIYKPRRSHWPMTLALIVGALVIGFTAGALVVGGRPPDLTVAAESIADGLTGSAGLLEVTQIEYAEAQSSGGSDTEYQGAIDNLARARQRYDTVSGVLAAVDPARAALISRGFDELRALVEQRAGAEQVETTIVALRDELLPD